MLLSIASEHGWVQSANFLGSEHSMFFSHVTLRNFGSFELQQLSFSPKGLNIIQGPNASGKSQIKGALLAPLLGPTALKIDRGGVGPAEVRVSLQEHDNKEALYLTVALNEQGDSVVKHGAGTPGAHLQRGPLAKLLRRAISAYRGPKLLLKYDGDYDTEPFFELDILEKILPNDLRARQTWLRFKANGGSSELRHSGSHSDLNILLSEFVERTRLGHRLPLIVDELPRHPSDEDLEFCTRILQLMAERSQVILLTSRPFEGMERESLEHTRFAVRTLAYYNGAADRRTLNRTGTNSRSRNAAFISAQLPPDSYERKEFVLDPNRPVALLLGSIAHEGILSAVTSTGRQYKQRMLNSSPENWWSIVRDFDDHRISCVVARITDDICTLLLRPDYASARTKLLERIAAVPNLMFATEDILLGEQHGSYRSSSFPSKESLNALLGFFRAHGVELVPYKRSAEITVVAISFLEDMERNLIFRLYVPARKMWSAEADRFLQLFQDYLSRIDRLRVRLDQKRTDHGTIYEFHGETPSGEKTLAREFQDFSKLMDLCASDASAAADLLACKNLQSQEITRIIERYVKEARRLQLDIKHEAESRMISLRHRVESELIEFDPTADEWQAIGDIMNAAAPQFGSLLPAPSTSLDILSGRGISGPQANITYNIRPQFIQTVNGIVSEEMSGTQHFDLASKQLLDFVRAHGGENPAELETAVHELADGSGKQVDKLKATQKIKGFLMEAGKRLGKEAVSVAFDMLHKIVEKKLGV
jgi:hypothetical protein